MRHFSIVWGQFRFDLGNPTATHAQPVTEQTTRVAIDERERKTAAAILTPTGARLTTRGWLAAVALTTSFLGFWILFKKLIRAYSTPDAGAASVDIEGAAWFQAEVIAGALVLAMLVILLKSSRVTTWVRYRHIKSIGRAQRCRWFVSSMISPTWVSGILTTWAAIAASVWLLLSSSSTSPDLVQVRSLALDVTSNLTATLLWSAGAVFVIALLTYGRRKARIHRLLMPTLRMLQDGTEVEVATANELMRELSVGFGAREGDLGAIIKPDVYVASIALIGRYGPGVIQPLITTIAEGFRWQVSEKRGRAIEKYRSENREAIESGLDSVARSRVLTVEEIARPTGTPPPGYVEQAVRAHAAVEAADTVAPH